ncbi:DUF6170 family protein [Thalassotalea sp. PP2-459]|uniref:DUF6170 family protein n=1 Tax=Thalassotalea sp. PP2-459 TaxID=1742724 RepID=UPI000942BB41
MAIYFSSKDIPELESYSIKERQLKLEEAQKKFTAPEKLILNILKLLMLIPPFFYFAQQEWQYFVISFLFTLLIFFFIFTPVKLSFSRTKINNRNKK